MKHFIMPFLLFSLFLINISFTQAIKNVHAVDRNMHDYQISNIENITFDVSSSEPLWIATTDYYPETANLDSIVTALYGSSYRVADWNDLVNYSQTHDIVAWADSIGMLNGYPYGFWVTRDGYHFWSGTTRHYWIDRHDGIVPGGWFVHATINNHFIDLGSWYNMMLRILCFRRSVFWFEDFEDDLPGQFPSPNWEYTGNSNISVDNTISALGQHSLKIAGSIGGCWEAIPCRSMEVNTSVGFTIQFYIRISSDHQQGCHPWTGGAGITTICDWVSGQGVGIIGFDYNSVISSRIGNLGNYSYDTWYKVKMKYVRIDPNTVSLTYWIDDLLVGNANVSAATYEDNLSRFHFSSGDGTVWVDEIEVSELGTSETIVASVICPNSSAQTCAMTAEINIDMSGMNPPNDLLGSFTATLTWDPALLQYTGNSGILSGFTGFINTANVSNGELVFNGAKPTGAGGLVDLLHVDFDVIGSVGTTAALNLSFSAMAAAYTFENLLPYLTVNNDSVMITQPGLLGDVNSDNVANSTDGLILLSYDVGIPLPQPIIDRINAGFGDVNLDNLTNSTDGLIVMSYDVGIPVPFPVGQPNCPSVVASTLNISTSSIARGETKITASAVPGDNQLAVGEIITIPVQIDVSSLGEKLGSFTALLEWNPAILQLESYSGGISQGFENPVVNDSEIKSGKLTFANADPYGGEGIVNVLNLRFKAVGEGGANESLSLNFSALATAETFVDLLPFLEISEKIISLTAEDQPKEFAIENFPNPFNPSTEIRYQLPEAVGVEINIYNLLGQKVQTLVNEKQQPGSYLLRWEGKNEQGHSVPSGMYFLRMQAGKFMAERKLLLLR